MKGLKKYRQPRYGELAPEVLAKDGDNFLMADLPGYKSRSHREKEARMTVSMMGIQIYPDLAKVQTTDTHFERDGATIPLKVYHPEGTGPFPIVMLFHGGGFIYNTVKVYDYVARYIAMKSNSLVVSVEYRLAPEFKFPTGLEDCYGALEWVAKNASLFNGDSSRISVAGDSSGGNYAAVTAIMARDRKGPKLLNQVLIYPVTDLSNSVSDSYAKYEKGYFLEAVQMSQIAKMYLNDASELTNPYVSPLLTDNLEGLPHAIIISAECDILIDEALKYAQRLSDSEVKVDYFIYGGMPHGFINGTYGKTFEALDEICRMLKSSQYALSHNWTQGGADVVVNPLDGDPEN